MQELREKSARRWCAEQELVWSGLVQLKGTACIVEKGPQWRRYTSQAAGETPPPIGGPGVELRPDP
ncbi:hypothetical protein EYF80_016267 [Liparis tanakae]|uniref:Uncharacterized protein n=1 Tax=Liparis tanakae TaxID=230148 RepID=A0A4Z2I617_9TELE|nr:hypothetical protein EYF80_016267 [Liparis tanakae]